MRDVFDCAIAEKRICLVMFVEVNFNLKASKLYWVDRRTYKSEG